MFWPTSSGFTSRSSDQGQGNALSPWDNRDYNVAPRGAFGPRSWGALSNLDDTMRDMERQFCRLNRWMDSAWRDFGRDVGLDDYWKTSLKSLTDVMHPQIVEEEGGAKKYRLNLHLGENFPPENVKVGLKDRVMTIEAKNEQKSEDGNSRVYREVSRKFTLPEEVNLKEIKSVMGPNGVLKVEAPIPQQALPEPPKPTEIPIHLE